jgi:MATE family multidrug resistance protein
MLCSGILLALSIQMLSEHLVLFDQKPEVLEAAKPYLIVMGWSILPALLFNGLRQFSEGLSRAHFPMIVMLAAVILNAFLNWLWIYGNWGFAAQGLLGAAWATFVTRFAMLFALIIFVLRSTNFEENLPLKWLSRFRLKLILEMIKLGVPSALQTLFEVGAFAGAAVMMGWISTSALAAHQIAISVVSMTFMVTLGLSFATSIRVSNAMGRKDLVAARRVGFIGISLGGVLMAYFGILILIAHRWLPKFYIEDQDVVLLASKLLIVGALFQIFDGVQGVAVGALRGLHDVVFPTVVTCVAYWLICIPFVYVLGFQQDLGPVGIWVGLSVGLVVAALLLTFRFHALTQRQILALALWGQTHGAPDPKVIEEA